MAPPNGVSRTLQKVLELVPIARAQLLAERRELQRQIDAVDAQLSSLDTVVSRRAPRAKPTNNARGNRRRPSGIQEKLFDALKKAKKPLTQAELVAATGLGKEQVYQALHRLVPLKRVAQKGETFSSAP